MSNIDMNTTDSMNKNPDFELPVEPGHGTIVGPIIPVGKLSIDRIETSDTISEFMEKVNNNFTNILNHGGGPRGVEGDQGHQGVPTKPKVPIHVWIKGEEYLYENSINGNGFEIDIIKENELSDVKYQEGHLIILENAHVYRLDNIDSKLQPKFITTIQSYDPNSIINGKNAYVHFAYANSSDGEIGFITAQDVMGEDITNKAYMGVYSDNIQKSSSNPHAYTWARIQGNIGLTGPEGPQGPEGPKGSKGDPGDNFTGHSYTIDLEGDMSTISIDIDRTILYNEDYCECIAHAYYGNENVVLNVSDVTINLPKGYIYSNYGEIINLVDNSTVGIISKTQRGNDVIIKFTPNEDFIFPNKSIIFPITINASIKDASNNKNYIFKRDLIWTIKGIVSTFELEIHPQYRSIKLFNDGQYYPEKLLVTVYKVEDAKREVFDFSQIENADFTLLYKNLDDTIWEEYPDEGVDTKGVSCLEFKVVRYCGSTDPEKPEEIWDYEDVWVVADGKSVHYYHADLGNAESMMVLTTGEVKNEGTEDDPIYCAELINPEGYSITFEPKFYDGTTELEVAEVNIGSINGEEYTKAGSFEYELGKLTEVEEVNGIKRYQITFKITKVPYNVDMIPMTFDVLGKYPTYDNFGNITGEEYKNDTVSFNVYISTLSNLYTLIPTVSTYNTSTGKDGDTIGCSVYKNNILIETSELEQNGLTLEYAVHDGGTDPAVIVKYTEPLVYGDDDDLEENEFTAKDVAIVFILSYRGKEVARSTVPLIKDGIDGRDGDSWQYIFCRSPKYPFNKTGISNPSTWIDNKPNDSDNELLGNNGISELDWYDEHKGVDSQNRYEYQAYRKWDKDKKCWGKYGEPTLYSNYSESGSGYSVILSNPIAVIPVGAGDNDWAVDENNTNQYDSTFVYLYNNTSDISSNNNVTISLPSDIEFVRHFNIYKDIKTGINKVTFTPVIGLTNKSIFDFGSNKQYKLPITVRYNLNEDGDHFTSTINWTLSPIKGLEDVELFVDKRVVNTSVAKEHTFRVGYYLINSNGNKKFIENANEEINSKNYQIILTDDISDLSNGIVENWQNATYNFVNNGENRNCYVVLVDSDGETIIDYVEVISVTDGNDGKSAIHLELTQDYIPLPANPEGITADNGAIHPLYKNAVQSIMRLYNGDKLISDPENPIKYSFKINGVESKNISANDDGVFTIPKSLIEGDTNIECIATYNEISYSKILFIDLEDTPYELEIDKNILTKNLSGNNNYGTIVEDTLTVRVKCWINGQWHYINYGQLYAIAPSISTKKVGFSTANEDDNCSRTLNIQGSILKNINDTEIRISFQLYEKEVSYETIGIINNGKDGTAPSLVKTTILGYSLNKTITIDKEIVSNNNGNDNYNTVWKSALNYLNPQPSAGQAIYILNEYEWSDGKETKKTRGITVTLAGTQGVDGNGRVLFYLGSYEEGKATLTDPIKTTFNDVQCDYYIDFKGDAWMRTGIYTDAGDSDGDHAFTIINGPAEINPYWVKSTKVGFLQAGAIHADMINTGSLMVNEAFISGLKTINLKAENLQVNAGNVVGTLTVGNTDNANVKISTIIDGINSSTNKTTIDGGKIKTGTVTADYLSAEAIKSIKIEADQITSGQIDANKINVINLSVDKLNTNVSENKSSVNIADNAVSIYDSNGIEICKFSDDNIGLNTNTGFGIISYGQEIHYDWYNDTKLGEIGSLYSSTYNDVDFYKWSDKFANIKNGQYLKKGTIINFNINIFTNLNLTDIITNDNQSITITKYPTVRIKKIDSSTNLDDLNTPGVVNSSYITGTSTKNKKHNWNAIYSYETPSDGMYSFTIGIKGTLKSSNLTNTPTDFAEEILECIVKISYDQNISDSNCLTIISKDGILINNKSNGILVGHNGIVFKYGDYGIKIDSNGINYSTNLSNNTNSLDQGNWKSLIS